MIISKNYDLGEEMDGKATAGAAIGAVSDAAVAACLELKDVGSQSKKRSGLS